MIVAQVQENSSVALAELPEPPLLPGGALVRMRACGLCGSDLDKLVHQKSRPGTVLGHEVVGVIEALDRGHDTDFQVGDRIVTAHHVPCGQCQCCLNDSESMCRQFKTTNLVPGGFSSLIALSRGHLRHTAFKVPDGITDDEASCMEPLACVLKAVRRGGYFENGRVGVIGLGFIGLMASQVYQNRGDKVIGVDVARDRLCLAEEENMLSRVFHPEDDREALLTEESRRLDLVFLTVVNPRTVALALELVRDGGTLLMFAGGSADSVIDPSVLYFREISVIPSYSPALQDLRRASEAIFNREIRVRSLCTHRLPLGRMQEAVELYRSGQAIKVVMTPQSSEEIV